MTPPQDRTKPTGPSTASCTAADDDGYDDNDEDDDDNADDDADDAADYDLYYDMPSHEELSAVQCTEDVFRTLRKTPNGWRRMRRNCPAHSMGPQERSPHILFWD